MKYVNVAFPYPSGVGLHIGHYYNYAIVDSYCRYLRLKGEQVFQPFGYDAFGLPAENYAKSVGRDPKDVTQENINNFRSQISKMNTQYEEKLITSDPSYQKWTQWIFTKLLEQGLAYKNKGLVNYCNGCKTVLANEQVKDNHCERCSTKVEMKELEQWYFKITAYKDRLIKNLDHLDYPPGTIKEQRIWLENLHDWCVSRQRSWGCPIPIEGEADTLDTFVDSSFYFVRYCDPDNPNELCVKDKYKQIDLYIIGKEHATLHLIYARFIHMFLYDLGIVSEEEPFKKVIHQGMILNCGERMTKSKGNGVSPDNYDPDELRFYLMFLGHFFDGGSWNDKNLIGITRFINKFKTFVNNNGPQIQTGINVVSNEDLLEFETKIENYVHAFKFNKVVSEFMTFVNNHKHEYLQDNDKERLISLLEIFMPGIRTKL